MKFRHIHIHIHEIFGHGYIHGYYPWKIPVFIFISMKSMDSWIYPWIYCIYRYYLQRESFNIRSFLIVALLKDHLHKPRRSEPHMNLIIIRLVLVSRRWNSEPAVLHNRAVLIGFIYKILFGSGILLFLRHVTVSMNIRIHIHEIIRLRVYSWILSMKKSSIHIRISMNISMDISIYAYPWRPLDSRLFERTADSWWSIALVPTVLQHLSLIYANPYFQKSDSKSSFKSRLQLSVRLA